jgi:hypothetical protein
MPLPKLFVRALAAAPVLREISSPLRNTSQLTRSAG